VSFFRKEVVEPALDRQARDAIEEQRAAIAARPGDARPYYNLAALYRMQGRADDALGLLLEAVRLDAAFAAAHVALAELYAVRGDLEASRRHADLAATHGDPRAQQMLQRWTK
jgi:tetratricopeptide (TPR) repeat protein